jgi:hypothetical protein
MRLLAAILCAFFLMPLPALAARQRPIAYVPIDDRPVTRQLPQMLGALAGRAVIEPQSALLGSFLTFGQPDAIVSWLNGAAARAGGAFVVSTDMLAYGGLVASRVPGTSYQDAYFRLRSLQQLRRQRPHAWIAGFGTIMRLAPTGVPAIGDAASFFAAYPMWSYLQQYANLHDPPLPSEEARAAHLRSLIGTATLDAYLQTRARDYGTDLYVIHLVTDKTLDRAVLGQDDAGPVGLHVKEVHALEDAVAQAGIADRISIEPGADELGMALVAHALARGAHWTPHIAVRYSSPEGASYQDPLEFVPISTTVDALIRLCGGVRDDVHPDVTLYVRVPKVDGALDDALAASLAADERAGRSVAFADLSFEESYAAQASFAQRLLSTGVMTGLDAYASWNTDANTVGTALAEAISAGAGRRMGTYDALAHRTFTFNRVLDDYAFHDIVRPDLNAWLDAQGITDHTYLLSAPAAAVSERNNALLWQQAQKILAQLYPNDHIAAMQITLPWSRTFETEINAALAPNL